MSFTRPFQFVDRSGESTHRAWGDNSHMGVQVMNRVLPEDSVVGSWDAGVIGYFSRFPVVNLDGLGNSYGYLRAQREGTEVTFYPRYGITHFANIWATLEGTEAHVLPVVRDYLVRKRRERPSVGAVLFEGPPYLHKRPNAPHKRQFRLLTPEPPDMSSGGTNRSEWFWQRMAPHFDHRSDGVGLVVDGRMAQAFVGDCMPDELAVWSWVGQGDETAVDSWTQTQTGLCVDVRVLPRNALPPVRVESMSVSDWVSGPLGGGWPIIRSDWDVYLVEDRLIYAKDQCSPEDAEPMFFLHLAPVDVNDLPTHRKQHGFDGLNFDFRNHLLIKEGICVARLELPDYAYAIAAVRTGQFKGEGKKIWEGSFTFNSPPDKSEALHVEDLQ